MNAAGSTHPTVGGPRRNFVRSALALLVLLLLPLSAEGAQIFEKVGTLGGQSLKIGVGARAAAMGDAYVALSDDATAVYWNPAGLATGAFVGVTLDVNSFDRAAVPFAGLATPPLGISYFRTTSSTAATANGRNGAVEDVSVHHAGATLVQSIGDSGLVVGGTAGLVHGNGANAFGADVGAMLSGSFGRIGLAVHNVTAPVLGGLRLDRQVRAGVSMHLHEAVTVAADVEFLGLPSAVGEWREAAVGLEAHPHTKLWVRSGLHWNTAGSVAAPVGSVGGSLLVYGKVRADAQASFGSAHGDRGWGVGLSFVY